MLCFIKYESVLVTLKFDIKFQMLNVFFNHGIIAKIKKYVNVAKYGS